MDWTVGNFVSSHCKNGYLKVWNVSQRQPVESIRVSSEGLVTVHFGIGEKEGERRECKKLETDDTAETTPGLVSLYSNCFTKCSSK